MKINLLALKSSTSTISNPKKPRNIVEIFMTINNYCAKHMVGKESPVRIALVMLTAVFVASVRF